MVEWFDMVEEFSPFFMSVSMLTYDQEFDTGADVWVSIRAVTRSDQTRTMAVALKYRAKFLQNERVYVSGGNSVTNNRNFII